MEKRNTPNIPCLKAKGVYLLQKNKYHKDSHDKEINNTWLITNPFNMLKKSLCLSRSSLSNSNLLFSCIFKIHSQIYQIHILL